MTPASRLVLDKRFWLLPVAIWSVVVAASFAWNWRELNRHAHDLALNRAQFIFKMVESVRLWNARHGGVYALVNEETPPNPYLEVAERDITTPGGRTLTMVNPAYMTRQLAEVVAELSNIQVHITSLKPINPDNRAQPWEARMLRAFERGAPEQSQMVGTGAESIFRYMAPLVTDKACLKCHQHQGYKVGDIRGGVSVSFDAGPLFTPEQSQRRNLIAIHLSVWLLLAGLTLFALSRFRRQMLSLDNLVEQRTDELRHQVNEREQAEAQLRLFIESSGEGIYGVDLEGRCTLVNPQALKLLGFNEPSQMLGKDVHPLIHHSWEDGTPHDVQTCELYGTLREGRPAHSDHDVFWRADGNSFAVEYRSHPICRDGEVIGAVVTFSDISERKAQEAELKKLSQAVEHSPASAIITDSEGRIEYVNQKFSELTGYTPPEVIGETPGLWKSGRTPQATYEQMWSTILAGEQWRGELLNRKRNGELFWEEASISPIKDDQGTITHFVALKEDITERKRSEQVIWHQAHHDHLTGLANRQLFRQRLETGIAQSDEGGHTLALLFMDLDKFKPINDRLGHDAGDTLLQEVARRLESCLRDTDTAARLGGDEFAILLPTLNGRDGAEVVADKVLSRLAEPYRLAGEAVGISASVGIALYPDGAHNAETLLQFADTAMYTAKAAGRNTYRFHQGE